jgi:hypothetical protein
MIITTETTVDELIYEDLISIRTYNACRRCKLTTVGDIAEYFDRYKTFTYIRNCGSKSSSELEKILLCLSDSMDAVAQFNNVREDVLQIFIDEYELFTLSPNKPQNLINAFQTIFPNYSEFYRICINHPMGLFCSKNYSKVADGELAYKVRRTVVEIIGEIARRLSLQLPENDVCLINITALSRNIKDALYANYSVDYCKYELSCLKQELLIREFNKLVENSSARAKSIYYSFIPDIYKLVPFINLDEKQFALKFGNKKKSCENFYEQILLPFKELYEAIIKEDYDDSYLNVAIKYPFLNKESTDFVWQFSKEKGHYPMFYIANELLKSSQCRDYQIYCQRYALGKYTRKMTIIEIANLNSLTRERIRQIISGVRLNNEQVFGSTDWNSYADLGEIFLSNQSDYFTQVSDLDICQ